jgi:hypothetical protein
MRVVIKATRTDGGWSAEAFGVRGFGVSPVVGATRAAAVEKARAAVLFGLSCAIEDGLIKAPAEVVFVARPEAGGRTPARRPSTRRRRTPRAALQIRAR